jgi:hypothetical protein
MTGGFVPKGMRAAPLTADPAPRTQVGIISAPFAARAGSAAPV